MPKVDLKFLIKLAPKKAIEYLKKKGYKISKNWYDTWQEEHVQAFTVAKITKLDMLMSVRELVEEALEEGKTYHYFKKKFKELFKSKGWSTLQVVDEEEVDLGAPWRLKNILQTNMKVAYSTGHYKAMIDNVDNRPFWQYWTVGDTRVRDEHRNLHGKVFLFSDPFWKYFFPPNGYKCRCSTKALAERDIARGGLEIEKSGDSLGFKDVLVSKKDGIKKPVAFFDTGIRDPATGKTVKVSPQPGFSYNPGRTAWKPDLDKYPKDLVSYYKKERLI